MNLHSKVVWITGASSGIGRQLAIEMSKAGALLALSARREDILKSLAAHIKSEGGEAAVFPCDVASEAAVAACVQQIEGHFGRVDIAVANAGFGVVGLVEKLSAEDWQRQLTINVTGLALTAKYAIPHLKKSRGKLVLIGSVAAYFPGPGIAPYAASKAAVRAIGQALMVELKTSGVGVLTIHPGFVESDIARVDNKGVLHAERADPRPANLMWPVEKAAQVMRRAIERRTGDYVFTGHGKIAVFMAKHLPALARKLSVKGMPPE